MPDAPIACSLDAVDFKGRLEELSALSQSALLSARRDDLVLHLRYAAEAEQHVRRMVEREQECCTFLEFAFLAGSDGVALRITAPEKARDAIAEIYAQFLRI